MSHFEVFDPTKWCCFPTVSNLEFPELTCRRYAAIALHDFDDDHDLLEDDQWLGADYDSLECDHFLEIC